MSGSFSVKAQSPANAWREKGYRDGDAGRPKRGPLGLDAMASYLEGYRHGERARARREEQSRSDRGA